MPDETTDQPETPVTEPIGPVRTLTPEQDVLYGAELGALGYEFEAQGEGDEAVGFRVTGNGDTYDYRYGEGESAVALMDRIVAERGA